MFDFGFSGDGGMGDPIPNHGGEVHGGVPSIGTFNGGTIYANGSGSGINWNNILNQAFGLGSQAIGAFGKRPTQQVGYGITGVGGGYSPADQLQSQAQFQQAIAAQAAAARGGMNTGGNPNSTNSLDGIFSSLTNTIQNNPLIFAAAAVGLFLLFREPPRGGRR